MNSPIFCLYEKGNLARPHRCTEKFAPSNMESVLNTYYRPALKPSSENFAKRIKANCGGEEVLCLRYNHIHTFRSYILRPRPAKSFAV